MFKRFIALVLLTILFPLTVFAQATADISLTPIPNNPGPGDTVRLILQSYATDLSRSTIVWRYNDKVVDNGIGRTAISVIAPQNGQVGVISATATVPGGQPVTATATLRPASIDVLWEAANAYTPPFYKGKALPVTNAQLRVTAIPAANAPKNISFTWKHGDTVLQNASGYNRSSFVFTNSELDDADTFSVLGTAGAFSGTGSSRVQITTPSLVGYRIQSGFIDYANGSTTNLSTDTDGIDIHFEPYYFSVSTALANDLQLTISAGTDIIDTAGSTSVALSRPANRSSAVLSVAVNSISSAFQSLTRAFTVSFY